LVGNMVNGSFTDVKSSGLNLSRVGIFRVDENGYLVDDQRSYVYGYAVEEGTGIPETPATPGKVSYEGVPIKFTPPVPATATAAAVPAKISINNVEITLSNKIKDENYMEDAVQEWITYVTKTSNQLNDAQLQNKGYENVAIAFDRVAREGNAAPYTWTAELTVTSKITGEGSVSNVTNLGFGGTATNTEN